MLTIWLGILIGLTSLNISSFHELCKFFEKIVIMDSDRLLLLRWSHYNPIFVTFNHDYKLGNLNLRNKLITKKN